MPTQRISAKVIIPGDSPPIIDGVVIITDGIIEFVGKSEDQPKHYEEKELSTDTTVPIIMPGLWDCHVHFFGLSNIAFANNKGKEALDIVAITPSALAIGRSIKSLQTLINYGITSVREVGGYGLHLKQLINEGSIIGPNIYSAGKFLSIIGGHTDFHELIIEFFHVSNSLFKLN